MIPVPTTQIPIVVPFSTIQCSLTARFRKRHRILCALRQQRQIHVLRACHFGYWVLVFSGAAVCNWTLASFPQLRLWFNGRSSLALGGFYPSCSSKSKRLFAQTVWLYSLLCSRKETVLVAVFTALSVILCFIDYRSVPDDPLFPTRRVAMAHYIANRTGIISTILIPGCLASWSEQPFPVDHSLEPSDLLLSHVTLCACETLSTDPDIGS